MSRSKVYLLLSLILLPIVAPFVLWQWQNYSFYRDFQSSEKACSMRLEVSSLDELHWLDDKEEVKIEGIVYDVISIHQSGSRYQIALQSDSSETASLSVFTSNTNKHKSFTSVFCFVITSFVDIPHYIFQAPLTNMLAWLPFMQAKASISLCTLSPPPNVFCC
jgi:hypothetical protein